MTAESIAAELLNDAEIKALVQQISLEELPQGTQYPALVYQAISANPLDYFCQHGKNMTARIQVNPVAKSMVTVNQIHMKIRERIVSFNAKTVAGTRLVSCIFYGHGPATKDDQGMWTKPGDYRIIFES